MNIKIRRAKKDDIKIIDKLYVKNSIDEVKLQFPNKKKTQILREFKMYKKNRIKGFIKGLSQNTEIWLVVEDKGTPVGFAQGAVEKAYGGRIGLIDKIYLNKKYRGKGLGIMLGRILMRELKKKKINYYESRLFAKNLASYKLNQKLGLKPFSLRMRKKA